MIAVIRIAGQVKIKKDIAETLNRLNLKKKYSCVVVPENKVSLGMIKKVENFVAYGKIDQKTFEDLIEKRGKIIDKTKKTDFKKVASEFFNGKKLKELNVKPFFRLHPPIGGIDSKIHFGKKKGVLGDNKEKINELIRRMI